MIILKFEYGIQFWEDFQFKKEAENLFHDNDRSWITCKKCKNINI